MEEVLFAIALAFVLGFSALGYLAALGALRIASTRSRLPIWTKHVLTVILYCIGVGSIFIAPAYLYGHYKTELSDMAFVVFLVSETVVVLILFVIAKVWIQFLPVGVRQVIAARLNSVEREQ